MSVAAKQDEQAGWWLSLLSPETLKSYLEYTHGSDGARTRELRAARQRRWRDGQKARLRDSQSQKI